MFRHVFPIYPSDKVVELLAQLDCIESWRLSEIFQPRRLSRSLRQPLPCLTPALKISGTQWLFQASASANISLQSGLLQLGNRYFYETNLANASSSSSKPLLRIRPGSLPPGWWHRIRSPRRLSQPLLLLSTHNNPNYFHWLTQPGLSTLFLQEHFDLDPLREVMLAFSHRPGRSLPSYVSNLLSLFAPESPHVHGVALTSDSFCRFALHEHSSEVVVSPAQLHWLRRRCREQLQPTFTPWRRVLISRRRSNRRRCLNEQQVFAALAPFGFEQYCLEDLSVTDQLRLFSESSLLVGAHGAGFTNLIACGPQATIVELVPRPGPFCHYYAMADALDLVHGHLLANCCHPETDDFTIATDDLVELLRSMEVL